jgi:transposase InsO family protein
VTGDIALLSNMRALTFMCVSGTALHGDLSSLDHLDWCYACLDQTRVTGGLSGLQQRDMTFYMPDRDQEWQTDVGYFWQDRGWIRGN